MAPTRWKAANSLRGIVNSTDLLWPRFENSIYQKEKPPIESEDIGEGSLRNFKMNY